MFPDEKRTRQAKLTEYIYQLSTVLLDEEKQETKQIADKLRMIYTDEFRHSYSDFFPVVLKIFEENNTYNSEYLLNNLQKIRELLDQDYSEGSNEYKDMYSQFVKLCEHLNLQISQLLYFTSTEEKVTDAVEKIKNATNDLTQARTELEEAKCKANTMQTELIAVLSIFAAIVITFSGGWELLGNAVSAVASDNVNVYILVLICLVCGAVFFNTIFLMMYLVAKITDRNIYAKCKTKDCSCGKGGKPLCRGITRIRKRLPYVFYFNILLIVCVICDIVAWKM